MNNSLSSKLIESFPNTNDVNLDTFIRTITHIIIEPNWLTGFIDGEGSFMVSPYT
jgi:hypothetical protein